MTYFFDLVLQDTYIPGRYVYETSDGLEWNLVIEAPMGNIIITETLDNTNTVIGITEEKTAGEILAFGDIVYFAIDGKAYKADASPTISPPDKYPAMAMAAGAIGANQRGSFLLWGTARNDAWNWTVGGILYLSTVAGQMTQIMPPSTDDVVQILGVAHVNADTIYFRPSIDYFTHT
jgi:hypothetical protein